MLASGRPPAVILICHQHDQLDSVGLASWLAATMRLAGIVLIAGDTARKWRVARREFSRRGVVSVLDAAAFRVYARLRLSKGNAAWSDAELARLRERYPASLEGIPTVTVTKIGRASCRERAESSRGGRWYQAIKEHESQ